MNNDTLLVPLSALQHYAFCPRQCALIHNEQVWAENYLTAHGRLLHERVDSGTPEIRKGIKYERSVSVSAQKLGLIGKLDLIEIDTKSGICYPVEYKRGAPKHDKFDLVQLCAQALCLEEMRKIHIEYGAMWYWQTRRRYEIKFDNILRQETLSIISLVKKLFLSKVTPKAKYEKKCDSCSLIDYCNPKWTLKDKSEDYNQALFCNEDN